MQIAFSTIDNEPTLPTAVRSKFTNNNFSIIIETGSSAPAFNGDKSIMTVGVDYLQNTPNGTGNGTIEADVIGYIFEKYINQKEMGAYYTKEDITDYIGKYTIMARGYRPVTTVF